MPADLPATPEPHVCLAHTSPVSAQGSGLALSAVLETIGCPFHPCRGNTGPHETLTQQPPVLAPAALTLLLHKPFVISCLTF